MSAGGRSAVELINHLLDLPQAGSADAVDSRLSLLAEEVRSDACATLLLHPGEGTAHMLGRAGALRSSHGENELFEAPFLNRIVSGARDASFLAPEGPFENDPFLCREEVHSLLVGILFTGDAILATIVFRRDSGPFSADEADKFNALSRVINLMTAHFRRTAGQGGSRSKDELTGLGLYPDFHREMVKELSRARRNGSPVTMGIMSIAGLDQDATESAMVDITRNLRQKLRNFDTLDRYGAAELACILPDLQSAQAVPVFERVLEEVASSMGGGMDAPGVYLGLSSYPDDGSTVERLIEMAEAAMNRALEDSEPGVYRWSAEPDV